MVRRMKRREFLKKGAIVAVGAAAASAGVTVVGYAADTAGPRLLVLNQHESETLLMMARQIFPHDRLDHSYYRKVVEDLDNEAATNPATALLLREGVAKLDRAGSTQFIGLSDHDQVETLKKIDSSPFFQKVQSTEIVSLYNNRAVWKQFGYPGASYPIGGYIHHGFNDLDWLPDPPEFASPKPG
jgi:hypothetical protein